MNLKKGAMFGLDARIALAILGALSVISGAALYSAIGQSKATAVLSDMKEIGKAWEAYYLDVGSTLPYINVVDNTHTNFYRGTTRNLVTHMGEVGWQGPYLSYEVDGTGLKYPAGIHLHVLTLASDIAWTTPTWSDAICVAGKKCDMWVYLNGMEGDQIAKNIDQIVDGGDGALVGDFRYYDSGDATWKYSYVLKYAPVKNPN